MYSHYRALEASCLGQLTNPDATCRQLRKSLCAIRCAYSGFLEARQL
jgi:hypothetical protein